MSQSRKVEFGSPPNTSGVGGSGGDGAPQGNKLAFVRFHAPLDWAALNAEVRVHAGNRFDLELLPFGVKVTQLDGNHSAIVPLANIKYFTLK